MCAKSMQKYMQVCMYTLHCCCPVLSRLECMEIFSRTPSMVRFHVSVVVTCGLTWMDRQRWEANRHMSALFIAADLSKKNHNLECLIFMHCIICCYHTEFIIDTQMYAKSGSSITGCAPCVYCFTGNLFEENFRCR